MLRSRPLYTLGMGDTFELRDQVIGAVRGQVTRRPNALPGMVPGYIQVRVTRPEFVRQGIEQASGAPVPRTSVLEWSPSTLVYLLRRGERAMGEDYSTDADNGDVSAHGIEKMLRSGGVNSGTPISNRRMIPMARISSSKGKSGGELAKVKAARLAREKAAKATGGTPVTKPRSNPKPQQPCACGCGEMTKSRFKQGHDGRYYGYLKKVVDGRLPFGDLNLTIRKQLNTPQAVKKAWQEHEQLKARNKKERES